MKLEKFISTLLHPVFIPTITIFIVIKEYSNVIILENQAGLVLLGAFIFTLLLPLVSVLLLLLSKKIKSVEMPVKEERILPIILTAISMITGFFFLKEIFVYAPIIKSIYLGALYIVLLSLIITKSWKISLHMLAVGGATGVFLILEMLFGQSQYYLMFFIFLAGVVGFARYSLKAHDLKQIYTGFILGLCIMCISIIYL